jgi:hypothetical protein
MASRISALRSLGDASRKEGDIAPLKPGKWAFTQTQQQSHVGWRNLDEASNKGDHTSGIVVVVAVIAGQEFPTIPSTHHQPAPNRVGERGGVHTGTTSPPHHRPSGQGDGQKAPTTVNHRKVDAATTI